MTTIVAIGDKLEQVEIADALCIRRAKELMRCGTCLWWEVTSDGIHRCGGGDGPYCGAPRYSDDGCLEWEPGEMGVVE